MTRPVTEWRAIAPACAYTRQYLFRRAIIARANFTWQLNSAQTFQQVGSVILFQIINLQLDRY